MQIGINGRLAGADYQRTAQQRKEGSAVGSWIASLAEAAKNGKATEASDGDAARLPSVAESAKEAEGTGTSGERSEAAKIYEAAAAGRENPLANLRTAGKVPYAYLAKDGIIEYNGVVFVCDEKTNSICLGDMTDSKEVITVALSGGGNLRVNRNNIGDLSKAVGMFSPEDLNRILRAIAQDTRIQSMEKEIEDLEGEVSGNMSAGNAAETEEE